MRTGFPVPKLPKGLLISMQQIKTTGGTWSGGVFTPGTETTVDFKGHITPLTDEDLRKDPNGSWSKDDQKLYCEIDFDNNTTIKDLTTNRVYEIQGVLDYMDLGTFRRYIIRRVGDTGEHE